ncbi:dihydrodipicolinate synthase family protein [Eisenbergiella porci]|uniref:dihydrodipicolinate synthase family protein n=1 Tax=Eisenbergiella porci TaxID=2652274 RepID=UPI002A7F2079|nr:dihydrodipicolinate synthase family protein [Eisenbergiella porci]
MKGNYGDKPFRGIYPALLTPISEDGKIKKEGLKKLVSWEMERGADGFYIGGATGECYSMDTEAREELAQTAINEMNGRGKSIVHIGAYSIRTGIRLAQHAESVGADAVSATPPPVYHYNIDEITEYYRILSEAVKIPMIVYINTMFTEKNVVSAVTRILELPNVIGAKFTRNNYYEMFQLSHLKGGKLNLLNGPDETLLCGLIMGADGGIGSTYNIMPDIYKKIYIAYLQSNIEEAQRWQFWADAVIGILLKFGQIQSMKYLFCRKGIDIGKAEKPGAELSQAEGKALMKKLKIIGYFHEYPELE